MMKQSGDNGIKTSCCIKTASLSSMDNRDIQETTLDMPAPTQPLNNNNKFHAMSHQKIKTRFPKKLAVDVKFSDIYYKTRVWAINQLPVMKEILHGVSGEFKAGELTAIMGPSGAGKSTLLNILAGYKIRGSEGKVLVNGQDRTATHSRLSCYIMQDDALRPKLTVKESMTFASRLKLGFGNDKEKHLMELLDMLGLVEHANTRAGSLSGGQKKRLSIALELISNPPVLYLDEPTTGLDSSSCSQCVSLLKLLAQQGRTVICTIHQPTALMFEMFDHLYALADGNCIYQGSTGGLLPFLAEMNLNCPNYHNPADFLIEVSSGEYNVDLNEMSASAVKYATEWRNAPMIKAREEDDITVKTLNGEANGKLLKESSQYASLASSEDSSINSIADDPTTAVPASQIMQFFLLYYRNLIILTRSYTSFTIRLLAHITIGFLFGYLYRDVGRYGETVFGNYVYLYGSTLFLVYTGQMAVTLSIPLEMRTMKREYFNRWYRLLPTFMAKILTEIPLQIIGCAAYIVISHTLTGQPVDGNRTKIFYTVCITASLTAQACGFFIGVLTPLKIAVFLSPTVAVMFSTFGFNIFYSHIPEYFLWLYHLSYFRAALHSLAVAVYGADRDILPCNELYCHYKYPNKFLDEMDIRDRDICFNLIYIVCFGVVLHLGTIIAVWAKLNKR